MATASGWETKHSAGRLRRCDSWAKATPMLPDGFEWRPFVNGPALHVADRQLAIASELDTGYRVDFLLYRRSEFFNSLEAAQRYCAAWSWKWEARIRKEVSQPIVRGW